jgi:tetratricopeptide (TPR) repeat protein
MRLWLPALVFVTSLAARDDQQLALLLKAQTDFDRVSLSPMPSLPDTAVCAQSQSAVIPVGNPEDLALLHYREGYCLLVAASVTDSSRDFAAAAAEFDKALAAWPARNRKPARTAPEPVNGGLTALSALSHLKVDGETAAKPMLAAAIVNPSCVPSVMSEASCLQWVETARQWLGRIALRAESLDEAVSDFSGAPNSGWLDWAQGKRAFVAGNYPRAVSLYNSAISRWKAVWSGSGPAFVYRLGPPPNLGRALGDLGGAQLLAGNPATAIATLDASLKLEPAESRTLFMRARARELSGQSEASLSDYNLAARAAFAAAENLNSGEAHLYRGIVFYRRKDFARAEDEFSSALNFSISAALRPDAEAWRHLAAVASGSCVSARQNLERSLATASPFFPKEEARALASTCAVSAN